MQKSTSRFNNEIRYAVAAEQLVPIPGFPIKGCFFVTPEMERIYLKRTGKKLPGICVVCAQFPAIMQSQLPPVKTGGLLAIFL